MRELPRSSTSLGLVAILEQEDRRVIGLHHLALALHAHAAFEAHVALRTRVTGGARR